MKSDKKHLNLSLPEMDTDPQTSDIERVRKEQGNTTPSTAASTRSSSSKCLSIQNAMSGLALSDSQSPSGHATFSDPPKPSPTRQVARNSSLNEGRRSNRTIAVTDVATPRDCTASPRSGSRAMHSLGSPKTRSSRHSDVGVNSSPRSSLTKSDRPASLVRSPVRPSSSVSTKDEPKGFGSPTSAASRIEARTASWKSSSGHRTSTMSLKTQQSRHDSSDEEREKVDRRMTQRAGQISSANNRQSYAPSLGRTNRIRLHIYDLIAEETVMQLPWGCHFPIGQCFNAVNTGLHTLGTGAYHVGVEVSFFRIYDIADVVMVQSKWNLICDTYSRTDQWHRVCIWSERHQRLDWCFYMHAQTFTGLSIPHLH